MISTAKLIMDAVYGGFMFSVGKFFAKIALRIGGTFVVVEFILTPMYNLLMNAIQQQQGDLGVWLELTRLPEAISVVMAAYGVRSASGFVFKKLGG